MSVEKIGGLVEAANRLTSEVAGKMGEIDQRVAAAVGVVPQAIRDAASQVFFVDAANGDDSRSGLNGTNSLKTIAGVSDKIVPGGVVQISLREDQVHRVDGNALRAVGCSLTIRDWGTSTNVRPKIEWRPTYDAESGKNTGRGFVLTNCSLTFVNVNIDTSNLDNGAELTGMAGFVIPNQSHVNVYLRECDVTVSDAPFATSYPGYDSLDVHMNIFGFTRNSNTNGRGMLVYNRAEPNNDLQLRMSARGVILYGGLTFKSILPIKADASNILTNVNSVDL